MVCFNFGKFSLSAGYQVAVWVERVSRNCENAESQKDCEEEVAH